MEIFMPVQISEVMREVRDKGAAFVPHFLTRSFCQKLANEIEAGPWTQPQPYSAKVKEVCERFHARPSKLHLPCLDELVAELGWLVRSCQLPRVSVKGWRPTHVDAQRYTGETSGMSSHKDLEKDLLVKAIVTVSGFGVFNLHGREREGVPKQWETRPGSLVLMQSTGFTDEAWRPFHSVEPLLPGHSRTVLIINMQEGE